jgi:hypothetical protein
MARVRLGRTPHQMKELFRTGLEMSLISSQSQYIRLYRRYLRLLQFTLDCMPVDICTKSRKWEFRLTAHDRTPAPSGQPVSPPSRTTIPPSSVILPSHLDSELDCLLYCEHYFQYFFGPSPTFKRMLDDPQLTLHLRCGAPP